jgi:hypothetical protein
MKVIAYVNKLVLVRKEESLCKFQGAICETYSVNRTIDVIELFFIPLNIECNVSYVSRFSSYCAVNTFCIHYETQSSILFIDILSLCF